MPTTLHTLALPLLALTAAFPASSALAADGTTEQAQASVVATSSASGASPAPADGFRQAGIASDPRRDFYDQRYVYGDFPFNSRYSYSSRGVIELVGIPRDDNRRLFAPQDPDRNSVQSFRKNSSSRDTRPADPQQLILVRTREPLPPIAISPWERIDERMIDQLRRDRPWIRRTDSILEDLRTAQQTWLRENGFTNRVVTVSGTPQAAAPTPLADHTRTSRPQTAQTNTPSTLHIAIGEGSAERVPSAAGRLRTGTIISVRPKAAPDTPPAQPPE